MKGAGVLVQGPLYGTNEGESNKTTDAGKTPGAPHIERRVPLLGGRGLVRCATAWNKQCRGGIEEELREGGGLAFGGFREILGP